MCRSTTRLPLTSFAGRHTALRTAAFSVLILTFLHSTFAALPMAHTLSKQVMVVHGGLFWDDNVSIKKLQKENRLHEIPPTGSYLEQALWSDPDEDNGRAESPRGCALLFGPDVTKNFLQKNGLLMVVRSHECMQSGFEVHHDGKVVTVFSASNYCGTVGNDGVSSCTANRSTPLPSIALTVVFPCRRTSYSIRT